MDCGSVDAVVLTPFITLFVKSVNLIKNNMEKEKQVQRNRIHFFLEENIKETYGECNNELKLKVLKDMINDVL